MKEVKQVYYKSVNRITSKPMLKQFKEDASIVFIILSLIDRFHFALSYIDKLIPHRKLFSNPKKL
jgi:hypothetical protein